MGKLVIVDDDIMVCELLATAAEDHFSQIEIYTEAAEFLETPLYPVDILMLDLHMPEIDGVETIRRLAAKNCRASIVLMSGYDESVLYSAQELAKDLGLNVRTNLTKPIGIAKLLGLLEELIERYCGLPLDDEQTSPESIDDFIPTKAQLQEAIENHQLILHYQPQVVIVTNTLVGLEALVRWQHPVYGLIYPNKIIPLAEHSGLITMLTNEVINLAVAQSKMWHEQGYAFKISVNVSAQNISNLSMPEYLESLVRTNDLDPHMLVLEVTESGLMQEITTSLDILTRMRLKGFSLSIDDFGTGFSSLSLLHRAPFTELKVDQSFVMNMLDDPQCRAIVETCIMLGHKLNMSVVAEGVENHKIWRELRELGCDIAQGYHVARPLAPDDLLAWYKGITRLRGINSAAEV